jgi:hypothetical protein
MDTDYIKQLEDANERLTRALDEHRNQVELFRFFMSKCSMRMILDKSGDVLIQYVGNILDDDKIRRMVDAYRTIKSVGIISIKDLEKETSDDGKEKV